MGDSHDETKYWPEPAKTSLKLENHQVLLKPLVTEKGMHRSERYNQYSFEINVLATKEDVRRAVEELFDVRVAKVRTQNRVGEIPAVSVSPRQDSKLEEGGGDAARRASD